MKEANLVVDEAKQFIVDNYKRVGDWSRMFLDVEDNTDEVSWYWPSLIAMTDPAKETVSSVSEVVLDDIDGDLSLIINGKPHNWISDESVIMLAEYIEFILEEKKKLEEL